MQLDLTDEQTLSRDTAVSFIEAELPLARTRDLHDNLLGYDRSWLQNSAELGWFAMMVPEADGGGTVSGAGLLDGAIIAEQLGRHVQPGPFIPMNVVAAAIAAEGTAAQRAALLPGIVAGEQVVTWAFADARGNWDAGTGLAARRDDHSLVLTGSRGCVQEAVSADVLLGAASVDAEPVQLLVRTGTPGLTIRPLHTLDLSRRIAEVEFRIAFGRPIGTFQAIKHILADQALDVETCKAAALAAAGAVQSAEQDAAEIASMAAAYIGDVACEIAQQCLQVHGGTGYAWEHDLHLFLRRVRSNAALYGESAWHRERVCAFHQLAGKGLSTDHQKAWNEESSGYAVPAPGGVASHVTLGVILPTLLAHASEQQKRDWIPRMLSGEEIWAQLLSEPGAGSALAGIQTRAVRDGENWVLTGSKIWSSGAMSADYGICLARTDWDVPKHRGLTWFKVPLHDDRVTVRPVREINGSAEFCEEFLDGTTTCRPSSPGGWRRQ
jgi:alkylation response protein AidB-like acyl-CoA dehydrogenase